MSGWLASAAEDAVASVFRNCVLQSRVTERDVEAAGAQLGVQLTQDEISGAMRFLAECEDQDLAVGFCRWWSSKFDLQLDPARARLRGGDVGAKETEEEEDSSGDSVVAFGARDEEAPAPLRAPARKPPSMLKLASVRSALTAQPDDMVGLFEAQRSVFAFVARVLACFAVVFLVWMLVAFVLFERPGVAMLAASPAMLLLSVALAMRSVHARYEVWKDGLAVTYRFWRRALHIPLSAIDSASVTPSSGCLSYSHSSVVHVRHRVGTGGRLVLFPVRPIEMQSALASRLRVAPPVSP